MKTILLSLLVLLSSTAFAGLSPIRHSGESFESARYRSQLSRNLKFNFGDVAGFVRSNGPDKVKQPLANLRLQEIPDVGSYPDLEREFKHVRDSRFLLTEDPQFPRRLTWLYPDDGCYARAEMAAIELEQHHFVQPKKIFVFGNLRAQTKNSPDGSVEWWYHVAVTYRVGATVYVFDPAIEPQRPLKLTEWNKAVGGEKTAVQYSICEARTFDPNSDCLNPRALTPESAEDEQRSFLSAEWNRLLELDRDPEKELGHSPPWFGN